MWIAQAKALNKSGQGEYLHKILADACSLLSLGYGPLHNAAKGDTMFDLLNLQWSRDLPNISRTFHFGYQNTHTQIGGIQLLDLKKKVIVLAQTFDP